MAALELASSTASPLPNLNASHDPDFDSFLNFDQTAYPMSESMKSNPSLLSQPPMATSDASIHDMSQSFSGPSHQYGDHQQQTGFPPDAVAHAVAYNENSMGSLRAGHQGFPMVDGNFVHMKRERSAIDFSTPPSRNHSEMDIETDNANNKAYFLPHTNTIKSQQFIDPNALGGHEMSVMAHAAPQAGRVYPGMHQQQAAMARAAQQHKQQIEIIRQQQQQQQQQQMRQQHAEQMAHQTPTQPFPTARPLRQIDPVVEERISRLLQQMRQNSIGQDSHLSTPTSSVLPQMAKLKKDEDDMDEDERLLASEEGKKLTSKERRQLRNKVSARAFRSRRKEYITQLESEIASKATENNELRMQNHNLIEENSRLTDLTRMLLSSPHFSDVLNELSANGLPPQFQTAPQSSQPHVQPQPQPAVSQTPLPLTDVTQRPRQEFPGHQQNFQVNMVMVPDNRMDVYAAGWNSGIDMNYTNASVFAVLEVPDGPAVDLEVLSGKSSNFIEPFSESTKLEVPQLERPPIAVSPSAETIKGVADTTYELDESDPSFALFLEDVPSTSTTSSLVSFVTIQSEKPSHYKLAVEPTSSDISAASVRSFERLCASIDAAFERVDAGTNYSHGAHNPIRTCLQCLFCINICLLPLLSHRRAATLASLRGLGRVAFPGTPRRTPRRPTTVSVGGVFPTVCLTSRYSKRVFAPPRVYSRRLADNHPLAEKQSVLPGLHVIPEPLNPYNSYNKSGLPSTYLILDPKGNRESSTSLSGTPRPMKYSYQVLSTPTADTPGTNIILQYEGQNYLFGHLAEGTQRNFVENGVSAANLNQIFITGKSRWANTGGVLGMILTIADSWASSISEMEKSRMTKKNSKQSGNAQSEPSQQLTIHGGKNLNHTIATARRFIFRRQVPLVVNEYDSASLAREKETGGATDPFAQPTWSDHNIKVWAMSLRPSYERRFESPKSGFKSPRKRSLNEFEERDEQPATLDPKVKDQLLRQHIVKQMLDSDWRLDTLHEERLSNVKMPATIFVRNVVTKDLERYTGPPPGSPGSVPDLRVFVRKPWPAAMIERLPATTPSSESMCYFVRSADQRGKFDVQKAIELGIPKGPAFGQLTQGNSYTFPDGKVVTPDMVLGPTRRGRTVAILDIPSELYIDDLLARPEWRSQTVTETLSAIFWILGPGVGDDPRIIDFASRMKHCDHIVSSTDYCPNHLTMVTAAKSTIRLARINNDNFIVPVHDNVMLPQSGTRPEGTKTNTSLIQKLPWKAARPGLSLDMEPKYGLNESTVYPILNTQQFITRMPKAVQQRLSVIQQRLRKPSVIKKFIEMREGLPPLAAESEVVTLGTGSSSPSKYRNVSATLLHVPTKGYYLFDCGENTLGQLKRVYSPEKLREVMQNLRLIWVSHLHADHHLGAVSVIKEWYKVNYGHDRTASEAETHNMEEILKQKRLCVISDSMFIQWLEEYAGVEDFGFNRLLPLSTSQSSGTAGKVDERKSTFTYRHIRADGTFANESPKATSLQFKDRSSDYSDLLREMTGLKDVRAVFVNHCRAAMAVTLEWHGGFKVSYSGDCRPSKAFTEIGKDSTLLIHEATFQDDLRGQALAKKHSTASEAIEVGRYMNARMVLLTHFSQRYAKISKLDSSHRPVPELSDARAEFTNRVGTLDVQDSGWPADGDMDVGNNDDIGLSMVTDSRNRVRNSPMPVCIAFDYMKVKIRDIPISQMYSPVFEKLIARLEQAADEESLELREREITAMQAKNPKKFGKGKEAAKLPSRPSTERKHSAWSASESESGWSDESDLDDDRSSRKSIALRSS
ncbi:hypothetical protein UA08_00954 [Talaromyces atroroseus]|uniref:ribonuclease Z n=1 Tax=Talaromyces atroroseus TaxID=1441469 RepID=A0A225B8A7_TALAT|nr:hypothetical protein UA08_00954 [Talaromyces atroroseus]OKL63626.1 hypothetical protein UA08_00954 [Talaromyces atroroseus]